MQSPISARMTFRAQLILLELNNRTASLVLKIRRSRLARRNWIWPLCCLGLCAYFELVAFAPPIKLMDAQVAIELHARRQRLRLLVSLMFD